MNRFDIQSVTLLALARLPRWAQPHSIPMLAPRGTTVSHLYKEIFVERMYASLGTIAPGERILDAGAHVGMASLFFLDEHKGAHVTSFEPNPKSARVLRQNLSSYGARSSVEEAALGLEAGKCSFFVSTSHLLNTNAGTQNRQKDDVNVSEFQVECRAIGDVLTEPFAFVKMDVEGAEYELLEHEAFRPTSCASL